MTSPTAIDDPLDPTDPEDGGSDTKESAALAWPERRPGEHFPVVGVGAASGGFEAFLELLQALPADLGMAIVFISHLSDGRDDDLVRAFTQRTQLTVQLVTEPTPIAPDHLYVMPHGTYLSSRDWSLVPDPLDPGYEDYSPIDHFLGSLAADIESCAIAVLLSGGGVDGTLGVREVKAVGGITIAQEPESARNDAMPRAAITTGAVDLILPPQQIAEELQRIGRHPYVRQPPQRRGGDELVIHPEQMHRIFTMLRSTSGVDFTHYKPPTIRRRLHRRMVLHKIDSVDLYIKYLRETPDEVGKLYRDLLIHVTRFFRDPESFKALTAEVFPHILRDTGTSSPIRIWLPGCSTGEEAYSIAIAILEFLNGDGHAAQVQIFATDVSETAVEQARIGVYPNSIASDVGPERLRRYFTRVDGKCRINKVVRDLCVFARQDLTRDPPFSKLDLILCRNVLIYMGTVLQRKLMNVFHYALKPSGYLMLGGAETVGGQGELFTVVDKKHRIFAKKQVDKSVYTEIPLEYRTGRGPAPGPRLGQEPAAASNMRTEVNRLILDRYGPPGVVVDAQFQIIQFRGKTGDFLEPAPGDAAQSLNVLKMAREGLLHGLQAALFSARKTETPVRKQGLRVHAGGRFRDIHVQVVPLAAPGEGRHYLVLFEDVRAEDDERPPPPAPADDHLSQIQDELAASREYLQSIIQDLEAANEELQSANEEILSSNEELQSTNEELDTAKEELQSTNEELNTVNEELHGRNDELSRVNSDLLNLLGSVEIAIVIVGADLAIRRFTPMAEKILNLIPTDLGRPISQIKPNIDCPELERMITHVIATVEIQEQNVRDRDGNWYTLRIRPYKNVDNRIDGAVLALFNIASRRHELELRQAHENIAAIIETAHESILVLDGQMRVQFLNRAFSRRFALPRERALEHLLFDLADGAWNIPQLRHLLAGLTPGRSRVEAVRLDHDFGEIGRRHVRINACCIPGFEPSASLVVLAIADAGPTRLETDAGMEAGV